MQGLKLRTWWIYHSLLFLCRFFIWFVLLFTKKKDTGWNKKRMSLTLSQWQLQNKVFRILCNSPGNPILRVVNVVWTFWWRMCSSDLITSDQWQPQRLLSLFCTFLVLSRGGFNVWNKSPNSLRRLVYLCRTSSWRSNKFSLFGLLLSVSVPDIVLSCSVFVDHPQSLLASLESLQSSELIEEHSAQLDWIIKVTCSRGLWF